MTRQIINLIFATTTTAKTRLIAAVTVIGAPISLKTKPISIIIIIVIETTTMIINHSNIKILIIAMRKSQGKITPIIGVVTTMQMNMTMNTKKTIGIIQIPIIEDLIVIIIIIAKTLITPVTAITGLGKNREYRIVTQTRLRITI
jgi:hypothetical protein